jgi:LCP family protein required for cell wall assembly
MGTSRKPKRSRRRWAIPLSIFAAAMVALGSYAGVLYVKADAAIQKIAAPESFAPAASEPAAPSGTPSASPTNENKQRPYLFLLAGIDNRKGSGGTLNTDALILASYNPDTRAVRMLSLPRDLKIMPDSLSARKVNAFYAYFYSQDKDTAIPETKRFFSDLLHLPIDYMAVINFDGLRQLVDAVGGVEVDVDMDMRYRDTADGTDINLKKGVQTLNGKQALDFVRYRKSNEGTAPSSDIARNAREQQVIRQILDRLASFQGMTQWAKVLDIVGDSVRTDVPESQLREWIMNYGSLKPSDVSALTVESSWKSPYIYLNEDEFTQALNTLRREVGAPEEDGSQLEGSIGFQDS